MATYHAMYWTDVRKCGTAMWRQAFWIAGVSSFMWKPYEWDRSELQWRAIP